MIAFERNLYAPKAKTYVKGIRLTKRFRKELNSGVSTGTPSDRTTVKVQTNECSDDGKRKTSVSILQVGLLPSMKSHRDEQCDR